MVQISRRDTADPVNSGSSPFWTSSIVLYLIMQLHNATLVRIPARRRRDRCAWARVYVVVYIKSHKPALFMHVNEHTCNWYVNHPQATRVCIFVMCSCSSTSRPSLSSMWTDFDFTNQIQSLRVRALIRTIVVQHQFNLTDGGTRLQLLSDRVLVC
jgi:hypothetical protein